MATVTVTTTTKKEQQIKEATNSNNLDDVIDKVKKIDKICTFTKCKQRTNDFAIDCKYCHGRFCTTHGLPEVHGCGEAVRRDEKRKFLHPHEKLGVEKHNQAQTKLQMKLKQMQQERKSKQGSTNKGNKKK